MQVGMYLRTVAPFFLLGGFVRSLPIALFIPPQSGEGGRESDWRLGRCEGLAKIFDGHGGYRSRGFLLATAARRSIAQIVILHGEIFCPTASLPLMYVP
jgi:hypothetical protein